MALQPTEYLVVPKPCSNPKIRLVCFPHSGAGPSAYTAWADLLDEHRIEVVAVSTPGRERRVDSAPLTDWEVLVGEICDAMEVSGLLDDVPYALFGHSLGAAIACETARCLHSRLSHDRPRPVHVFVSAHPAPAYRRSEGGESSSIEMHQLGDADLVQELSKFGLLTSSILQDDGLLQAVMPALRADIKLYETYAPTEGREPVPFGFSALGGEADVTVPQSSLYAWNEETTIKDMSARLFPGGHFFIDESREEVVLSVRESLDSVFDALPLAIEGDKSLLPHGSNKLVHEVIAGYATSKPGAEALVHDSKSLSFAETMYSAELLAMALQAKLEGKDSRVIAMLMGKSTTYAVGMIAIFKAASTLLAVETHFPPQFLREICEDCCTRLALASPDYAPRFQDVQDCHVMELDANWVQTLEAQRISCELPIAGSSDICCLTMTSGTTGKPKTIACSHRYFRVGSLCRSAFPLKQDDRMGVNVMFVWEVLWPLAQGLATYIIPDNAVLDPHLFVSTITKHNLTRTLTTPSLLSTILQHCASDVRQKLGSMRLWLTCGEVLPMSTVHAFQDALPQVKLVNDYSTWESGDVGFAIMSAGPDGSCYMPSKVFAPAGELAPGKVVAIVDPDTKKLLPKGVPGEVYIGGEGVSDGYFNKPEVTADRFVNGFLEEMTQKWGGKWYKTGDIGRLTGEPAVLEIRGRSDSTVKLRGFKVGIPTVEAAIQEIPGVAMCAAIPVYSSPGIAEALVCFIGIEDGVEFDAVVQAVKTQGPKKLPRFMMPSYYRELPTNAISDGESRKLNRKKLSEGLTLESLKVATEAEAPESEGDAAPVEGGVRGIVRKVWAKALNLNPATLDLEENFFDLGGHSTLAAQIASELSGEYGLPITVLDIYSHSSLGQLLELLDPHGATTTLAAPALPVRRPMVAGAESIAVVGVAGRFPGADDTNAFWSNLKKGAVAATFISPELLRNKGVPEDVIKHKEFVPCAYMINDADKFDNQFFGIGRHEATLMDPQHRVFIEVAWAALENAGLPPRGGLSKSVVGVFAAAGIDGYLVHHLEGSPLKDTMDPQDIFLAEVGNEKDYIATRVSYLLDFTGPSMNVNSACSSALVAAVQGSAAIAAGQCDAAVAGASSITFPNLGYRYQDGLVNSIDGYVRPFDKDADGTVFGDACGAVILQRLDDQSKRSLAWGTLRGFAVTNDGGQKAGYAAPSPAGQSQAVMGAMRQADIDPWSISYVECHCTGTRVGDGIEVRGLLDSFLHIGGKTDVDQVAPVALGSVKGNIAHANCAAGVTGLSKVLLMMRSRELAPTANFKTLNPKIDLKGLPFFITSENARWDVDNKPRRAGVSSFGIGGTNAHIIVQEPPAAEYESIVQATTARWNYHILPLSAKSPGALRRTAERLMEGLRQDAEDAPDPGHKMAPGAGAAAGAAFALQVGRVAHPLRQAVIAATSDSPDGTSEGQGRDLRALAQALEENLRSEEELEDLKEATKKPTVAFLFPGQGSQYLGMARGLYEQVPLFREAADQCCEKLRAPEFLGFDLRPILFGVEGPHEEEFARPTVLQPSLFIVEYAVAQVLLAIGITPVATAGHSLGEYAAAVIGGLLPLDGALSIVAARAKSTETLAEEGAMLSVAEWSAAELAEVESGAKPGLWLAAVNSPIHAVISGEVEAITKLEQDLKTAGRKCTRLHIKKAFHSGLVAKAADTLIGLGAAAETGAPEEGMQRASAAPVASNFSGGWLTSQQLQDGTYWTRHMRGTVRWRENAEKLLRQWRPSFVLEVGPGNALSMLTSKCVQSSGVETPAFVQAMRHPKDTAKHDVAAFLGAVGSLWEGGCNIDWHALHTEVLAASRVPDQLRLPTYAFEPTSIWKNPERSIYVESQPRQSSPKAGSDSAPRKAKQSNALVRYADRKGPSSIKAYCLPFAGGSSVLFAPWAETEDAIVEVVALELPGRGARSEEAFNKSDADDNAMVDAFCDAILADLAGAEYVLVGCSMGGNLCMEMALRLAARQARMPLAVYIAGRRPPAQDPSSIVMPAFTDAELLKYLVAPPEVASSPAFLEHMVPLLRADLQVDTRAEMRLSQAFHSGMQLPAGVALEVFCGTNDDVSPWRDAPRWQMAVQVPAGVHYFPGGHEFMMEHRAEILARWRRDAIGRLVQRRSAEIALLSAHGFAVPGVAPAAPIVPTIPGPVAEVKAEVKEAEAALPLYAVRWLPATSDAPQANFLPFFMDLAAEIAEETFLQAVASMQSGAGVLVACTLTEGALVDQDAEVRQCWRFVQVVHRLLEAGTSGRLVVVCPAAATGSMVAGASKAIAMEASELQVQRLFAPADMLQSSAEAAVHMKDFAALVARFPDETDLWAQTEDLLQGAVHAQRLERAHEPSARLPCIQPRTSSGERATFLLTGATGGLGQALVEWLVSEQQVQPEQLVLLRRAGSTALSGILSKCKAIEVKSLASVEELCISGLKELKNVSGIFHLAGVLDDGVLASMTEERLAKVAQPKCGIASSLLRVSTSLGWHLQWFLGFSSTSSLFGYAGQTNYCAANALLDNLATFGASGGRPDGDKAPCRVIAVNWGPWGEAGMAKKGTKAYEQAVKEGDTPLSTAVALRCLAAALRSATPAQPAAVQLCACDVAWERSQWKGLPILNLVADKQDVTADSDAAAAAAASVEDDAASKIQDFIVMHTTGTNWTKIQNKTLIQLGLDSLETVQLRNAFNKEFKVNVPLGLIAMPSQKVVDLVAALTEHVSGAK